ncbi:hypothetical protein [Actinoplanes sp. NPDC023714]|uniref:MGH1-like glycoside hydrolase domain-containing protein n=1 Tax=Actinoplanes sp. NPDC023714 TaxID=3154322 RepID=UPI0033FCD7A9
MWNEDGLAGISDREQRLCFALALWNGRDPILKERLFGLSSAEGSRGESAEEFWWYVDAVPSSAWLSWRYHYPQRAFPYDLLVSENRTRFRGDPPFGLLDTGAFDDDRYWIVEADYAKAGPEDLRIRLRLTNAGPEAATLHVLPTLWFRNTWSQDPQVGRPRITAADGGVLLAEHETLGRMVLEADPGPDGLMPEQLYCENESAHRRPGTPYGKDGIGDHVLFGTPTVSPRRTGTKASFWYRIPVDPGETAELSLRLASAATPAVESSDEVLARRRAEADEFYDEVTPEGTGPDQAMIMRRACATLLWGRQFYHDEVRLTGLDRGGHVRVRDVVPVVDPWAWPWLETWESTLYAVAVAHLDPRFAKDHLALLLGDGWMSPDCRLPAGEQNLAATAAPIQAWAVLQVFRADGSRDHVWLVAMFSRLLLNHSCWFAGTDLAPIGPLTHPSNQVFDRSMSPVPHRYEAYADTSAWPALHCLAMRSLAEILAAHEPGFGDLAGRFTAGVEHFAAELAALELWNDHDGWYYDVVELGKGPSPRIRSLTGLVPVLTPAMIDSTRAGRILDRALDPGDLLSPYGIRSVTEKDLRGTVWLPFHLLVLDALRRLGRERDADDLAGRLLAPWSRGPGGRRPILGDQPWPDLLAFHDDVDPDSGRGIGHSHATGAAGLVAHLIAGGTGMRRCASTEK